MDADCTPIHRDASRAVMLDPDNRVLLVRFENIQRGARWWATPGGGLKPGETHEGAVIREIREETGYAVVELGPWIWTREQVFPSRAVVYEQEERFFLIRVPYFDAQPLELDVNESDYFRELRWWTLRELKMTSDELSPGELPALIRTLVEEGPPPKPINVGF